MDDLLYNSCLKYFTSLANFGFRNDEDVKKLLFYVFIQELVNTTSLSIPEADYKHLEGALYSMYGTTCLMPYPDYCTDNMTGHFGDVAELSARMAKLEESDATQDSRLNTIESTNVIKSEDEVNSQEIADIILAE